MGGCQSASLLELSGGAGVPGWLVLLSGSLFPSKEDLTADCSTTLGSRSSGLPSHESVHERRSWCGRNHRKPRKRARKLQDPGQVWSRETRRKLLPKRPVADGESMDTTEFGAISPTVVQDCSQAPTQVLLSPRSQRLDALQPSPSPVRADIARQLQVLTASVQSIATYVRQLAVSLQAEVTEMKIAENDDDELEEHDGFPAEPEEGSGQSRSSRQARVQRCCTCAVLSHPTPGARGGTRLVTTVSVASETSWCSACVVALAGWPATQSRIRRAHLRAVAARRVGKMRTRPRRIRPRRVAPYTAVRVGETPRSLVRSSRGTFPVRTAPPGCVTVVPCENMIRRP